MQNFSIDGIAKGIMDPTLYKQNVIYGVKLRIEWSHFVCNINNARFEFYLQVYFIVI